MSKTDDTSTERALEVLVIEAFERGEWETVRRIIRPRLGHPGVMLDVAHGLLGLACDMLGDPAAADHLERAVELGSEEPEVFARLALHLRRSTPERACKLAERAFELGRRDDHAVIVAGLYATDLADHRAAVPWFGRAAFGAEATPLRLHALITGLECAILARCGAEAERFASGLVEYDKIPAETIRRGLVALASTGWAPAAFEWLVDRLGPARDDFEVGVLRVEHALVSGRGSRALDLARGLHERFPEVPRARWVLASVHCRLGEQLDEASRLLGLVPGKPNSYVPDELLLELGKAYAARGEFERAYPLLASIQAKRPADPVLNVLMARIHSIVEAHAQAARSLEAARAADPAVDAIASAASSEISERLTALTKALAGTPLKEARVASLHRGHNGLLVGLEVASNADASAGESLFVKAYRPGDRTAAQVAAEVALLAQLADHGEAAPATPRPLGICATPMELAGWPAFAMTALPGKPLPPHELLGGPLSDARAAALGEALGQLQGRFARIDAAWTRTLDIGMTSSLGSLVDWAIGARNFETDFIAMGLSRSPHAEAVSRRVQALFPAVADLARRGLERGIIHGDFAPHNALWDGARLVAMVDFDYAARDYSASDLAICLGRAVFDWDRLNRTGDAACRQSAARALLEAYGRARTASRLAPWPVASLGDLALVLKGVRVTYNLALARVAEAGPADVTRGHRGGVDGALSNLLRQLDYLDAWSGFDSV